MSKFDFIAALEADGAERLPWGEWKDDLCRYRQVQGIWQVAVRATWNKWGDSVDFVFSEPRTEKGYRRLRDRLRWAIAHGRYSAGYGDERWVLGWEPKSPRPRRDPVRASRARFVGGRLR